MQENLHRVGIGVTAPARRYSSPLFVVRGPVPRHVLGYHSLAGDRPPRDEKKRTPGPRSARACPSHAFRLKQDGQDAQDLQDRGEKGLEDLNVYRTSAQSGEKVREDLNRYNV